MVEFVTVSRIFPSGSGQSAASINWTERLGAWGRICFRGMRKTRMVITMITMMTWWTWRLRTSSLRLCWGKSGYLLYVILPVAYLSEVEMITVCCFMCVFVRVRAVVAGRCLKVLLERCPESRASRWVHAAIYFWGWCLRPVKVQVRDAKHAARRPQPVLKMGPIQPTAWLCKETNL